MKRAIYAWYTQFSQLSCYLCVIAKYTRFRNRKKLAFQAKCSISQDLQNYHFLEINPKTTSKMNGHLSQIVPRQSI